MAIIKTPLTKEQIALFSGTLDFYKHNGLYVIRKWPKKSTLPLTPGVLRSSQAMADSRKYLKTISGPLKQSWRETYAGNKESWLDMYTRLYMEGWKEDGRDPALITDISFDEDAQNYYIYFDDLGDDEACLAISEHGNPDKTHPKIKRGTKWRTPYTKYTREYKVKCRDTSEDLIYDIPTIDMVDDGFRNGDIYATTLEKALDEYWSTRSTQPWRASPVDTGCRTSLYYELLEHDLCHLYWYQQKMTIIYNTKKWYEDFTIDPKKVRLELHKIMTEETAGRVKISVKNTYRYNTTAPYVTASWNWDCLTFPRDENLALSVSPDDTAQFFPSTPGVWAGFEIQPTPSYITLFYVIPNHIKKIVLPKIELRHLPDEWLRFIINGKKKSAVFVITPFKKIRKKKT